MAQRLLTTLLDGFVCRSVNVRLNDLGKRLKLDIFRFVIIYSYPGLDHTIRGNVARTCWFDCHEQCLLCSWLW